MNAEVDVEVESAAWTDALPQSEALARSAALAAMAGRDGGDLVVLLTDDTAVRDLNAQFRGKDSPTNVLAFPAPCMPGGPLGDIALAYGVCAAESAAQGKPLADHLRHLVVHGVLHLLGYDHMDDAQAEVMESLEVEVLAGLGVADPYACEREDAAAKDTQHHGR